MAESDGSSSFASMSLESGSTTAAEAGGREVYSLIVIVKSLVLDDDVREDDQLELRLTFGESEIVVSGTLAEINEQRRGSSLGIPVTNSEKFKRYLMGHSLNVVIKHGSGDLVGRTVIQLSAMNLTQFEPSEFEPTIVSKVFPLERNSTPVGKISVVLKTDRIKSAAGSNIQEEDSLLYIVNDTPQRRSVEYQEDTMKQLLMCKKCDALKSPSEISYQYELIDGILVNNEHARKDPDLETMKRKIGQIEREAKLYPVGQQQQLPKENGDSRFCNACGGYSITGATCKGWKKPTAMPSPFSADNGCPDGTRFVGHESGGQSEQVRRMSEPNFAYSGDPRSRLNQTCLESYPQSVSGHDRNTQFCPKSAGGRFCQRCGVNMDWLPLHSGCPKCGFKPFSADHQTSFLMQHEIAPNRLDSWMGSFELVQPKPRKPSADIVRSASLESVPCPLCHLRGGRCPDCENRRASAGRKQSADLNSTTLSSTSDSDLLSRKMIERPKTRPSLRDRFGGFPKRIDKATRVSELFKAYGDKTGPTTRESKSRRSTRSSIVSLDVDKILQKSEAHKRKATPGGEVQCIELRTINPPSGSENGCTALTSAQIRKNQRSMLRRVKKQNRGRFSYLYGNQYPGVVVGHRDCIRQGSSVPPHMGWLWNIKTLGIGSIRRGWRPGAIRKPIMELMQHFLVSYPLDNIPVSKKAGRSLKITQNDYEKLKQKPTLQIVKRNGEYCIVMNPLKDAQSLKTAQDPYLPCEPIRFKLAKDPYTGKFYRLRKALKVKGFTMCGCKEIESCEHRSDKEKKLLQREMKKLSKCLGLPKSTGLKDIPSNSESELDLEFTPPSAMLKSGVQRPDVVCTETQYCVDDYKVQMPADKLKCQPGREDGHDVGKGTRVRIGGTQGRGGTGGKPGGILKTGVKNTGAGKTSEIGKKMNAGSTKGTGVDAAKGTSSGGKSAAGTRKNAGVANK